MTHSPKKKIWAGALCALVALVAAVVVAQPAAAAPAEAQATYLGYSITKTGDSAALPSSVVTTDDGVVTLKVNGDTSSTFDYTFSGTGTAPIVIDVNQAATIPVITLQNLSVSTGSAVPITINGTIGTAKNVILVVEGNVSLDATGGQTALSAGITGLTGLYITGTTTDEITSDPTFAATTSGTSAVLSTTATDLTLGVGLPSGKTPLSGNAAIPTGAQGLDNEVNATLSCTSGTGATVSGTKIQLAVQENSALTASAAGEPDTVLPLGTGGTLAVNGTMTVSDSGATTTATAGVTGATVTVGGASAAAAVDEASLTVTTSGAAINASNAITVNGGELDATSQAVPDATAQPAVVGAAGITCPGGLTVNGGTVVAKSAGAQGIDGNGHAITVTGGDLSATGLTAGIALNDAAGALVVNNTNSGSVAGDGPTVEATATGTEDDGVAGAFYWGNATLANANGTVTVATNSGGQAYLWVAQSGTEGDEDEQDQVLVRGFAGMADPSSAQTFNGKSDNNPDLVGNTAKIYPNPISSLGLTVSPFTGSMADGKGNGFMVVNTPAQVTQLDTPTPGGGYAYKLAVDPVFSVADTPALADSVVVAANMANVAGTTGANHVLGYEANTSNPYIYVTNNQTGTYTVDVQATRNSTLVPTYISGLYNGKAGAANARLASPTDEIPVSYQVSFVPNVASATVSAVADGDNANTFGSQSSSTDPGVYFTKPGEGTLMAGTDPSSSKALAVSKLPIAASGTNLFLGWYEQQGEKAPYTYAPITAVPTASQNSSYYAFYGTMTFTNPSALIGSPATVQAGQSASFSTGVKIVVADLSYTGADPADVDDIPVTAQTITIKPTTTVSYKGAAGGLGAENGVTAGDATVTGTAPNFTVSVPVSTSASASQGTYTVTVAIGSQQIPGVLNVEGVAPATGTTVMRLYNRATGEHLLTTQQAEITALTNTGVWVEEGEAWIAPSEGQPVYRLYNPNSQDHYFTTAKAEAQYLQGLGWSWDNSQQPVFYGSVDSGYPVYQLFNPNATRGTHLWTVDEHEYDVLSTTGGWQGENAKWFALDIPAPDAN